MFIVTMVKFIMGKPTMAQLIMIKSIIMAKVFRTKPTIVRLAMVGFNFYFIFHR
jgi:hypothetical protein